MGLDYLEVPIYDNVQGFVKITRAEEQIIDSLYFQRLRHIKQLSFADYVFPGAVHNRFSHSLGVLAVVSDILDRLEETSPKDYITQDNKKVLRMAALLHDIGHYPYSHMIEQIYKNIVKELNEFSIEDDIVDCQFQGDKNYNKNYDTMKQKYPMVFEDNKNYGHHEVLGSYIIRNTRNKNGITNILLENGFTDEEIENISLIIQGKSPITWFNQIIHSELDADRIDYLLRDAYATGAQYGRFDYKYLIKNCRLVKDKESNQLIFTIRSSAVFTIEHFLLARYFWYAQIICERTITIFDEMAKTVYKWMIEKEICKDYFDILESIQDPYEFFKFNDKYFWDNIYFLIENPDVKKIDGADYYIQLAEMILKRKPLVKIDIPIKKQLKFKANNCITEIKGSVSTCKKLLGCPRLCTLEQMNTSFNTLLNLYRKTLKNNGINDKWIIPFYRDDVSVSKLVSQRTPDENERDPVRILEKNDEITMLDSQPQSLISNLSEQTLVIPRIYVKEEFKEYFKN